MNLKTQKHLICEKINYFLKFFYWNCAQYLSALVGSLQVQIKRLKIVSSLDQFTFVPYYIVILISEIMLKMVLVMPDTEIVLPEL